MRSDREKKIFLAALWIYLLGSIIFFITYLSLGRIAVPLTLWIPLLLISTGFLVFLFLPPPGRRISGPPGKSRPAEKWYPRSLADIVERKREEEEPENGLLAPGRPIEPVPFIPLALILIVVIMAFPGGGDEADWRESEVARINRVFERSQSELQDLEKRLYGAGGRTVRLLGDKLGGDIGPETQARLIQRVDSLAAASAVGMEPFAEMGIQVYTAGDERLIWGGKPRHLRRPYNRGADTLTYTSRSQLYTLLVCEMPAPGGNVIVIDIPLEVNYWISNRFLSSTGLGEILSERTGFEVEYNFWLGIYGGSSARESRNQDDRQPGVIFHPDGNPEINGTLSSIRGLTLAQVKVKGDPFSSVSREKEEKKALWAGLILTLSVIIIARWIYHLFATRSGPEGNRAWKLIRWIVILVFFLVVIRYLLLKLDLPRAFGGFSLFDPALFADDLPGGLMKTMGDFIISSLFLLMFVFGSIKAFRTCYRGDLERGLFSSAPFHPLRLLLRAALLFLILAGITFLATDIVSRVVLNSNPRLIGLETGFFKLPILSLHLAMLFTVSAIFMAAIFLIRLIMIAGGGGKMEGLFAALFALALFILFLRPSWMLILSGASLLLLSARIFPLLKKEEVLSVIFSSFFLVLICSLVIYNTASARYGELRRSRVLEKAQGFNYPEDNWLQLVLPEICEEITRDRSIVSKILSRRAAGAFEVWAGSDLSRFNLSCVFDVYDSREVLISRFSVGMPFEIAGALPETGGEHKLPTVLRIRQETKKGAVHYLVGISPIYHLSGRNIGRVEIKIPYFYENPGLLIRAGPMAPEIFQNIERGSLAPRIDEPEYLLVAKIGGGRVLSASSPLLPAGTTLPGKADEWFIIGAGREKYHAIVKLKDEDGGFLVGYRVAGLSEDIIQWATLVSLDILLAVLSLLVLYLIRQLPVLSTVTPAVSFRGGLSFKRKLLLSFLVVSILPVVLMGAFSGRYIRYRFRSEGERLALSAVQSAASFIEHSIRTEAEAFAGSQYLKDILQGVRDPQIRDISIPEGKLFTLLNQGGEILLDENLSDFDSLEIALILRDGQSQRVTLTGGEPELYGGAVIPVTLAGEEEGYLFYRRRLDDAFVKKVAGGLGRNINIYYQGFLRASSERELFTGGFLNPLLAPAVFAGVALERTPSMVMDQSLGDYSYQVASAALPGFNSPQSGVLSVPLLYHTAMVQKEILRTYAFIAGLLALIFSVAVTLGIFLAGKIFTPISALSGGTRRIIRGDLEFKLEAEAPDEIGELVNSFNTMTSALREARRGLLERQRYLSAVLDNVAAGVVSLDREGKVMTINPSGETILNISRDDLIGKRPGEIKEKELEKFFRLFSLAGPEIREDEITLFSGERKKILKTVVASLFSSDERLGTVVVFDDLTELIRSKKLSAWIEMARQIAHEVKNPLTPIKLSVQLMQRAYREKSEEFDEIFKSGVGTVIQQTDILRQIVAEFSSFGKASNLKNENISLPEFLSQIVASYQGVEKVSLDLEIGARLEVWADREALRKIMVNLLENALEAMTEGGKILVYGREEGEMAAIGIVDSGPGLPGEVEDRLFEPYFSTKTNGTGLGLAICQRLAREMEGDIILRNRAGESGVEAIVKVPRVKK
ncbi:MAG: HAMP domain-containing protein [Candidatus Krumholzibacteriota bacterium]|nr:HAMP domain-containing protein [Candidatus Krumholzibacteriota bacterium]